MAEQMPFGFWTWMGPRNHVTDGINGNGNFWRKRAPIVKYRDFLPWGFWTQVGPRKHISTYRLSTQQIWCDGFYGIAQNLIFYVSKYFHIAYFHCIYHTDIAQINVYIFTTHSELWKVLSLAPSVCVFFVCVWNISGTAEQICTKFTRRRVWPLARRSVKVKVTREKQHISALGCYWKVCVRFMLGKAPLASSYIFDPFMDASGGHLKWQSYWWLLVYWPELPLWY